MMSGWLRACAAAPVLSHDGAERKPPMAGLAGIWRQPCLR